MLKKFYFEQMIESKYNINNFYPEIKRSSKSNILTLIKFFKKLLNSSGNIFLNSFAICGFGDISNLQMLYEYLVKNFPKLKPRMYTYAYFYQFKIPLETIKKLLNPAINIFIFNNPLMQWDPNYGYLLLKTHIQKRFKPEFEIQYNVGTVLRSVTSENILRVGEIGGMAGVSMVKPVLFTGLARGGIGFGIPTKENSIDHDLAFKLLNLFDPIKQFIQTQSLTIEDFTRKHIHIIISRTDSIFINQRPFINSISDNIWEGKNISVGQHLVSLLFKSVLNRDESPLIVTTTNIEKLKWSFLQKNISIKLIDQQESYKLFKVTEHDHSSHGYIIQGIYQNGLLKTFINLTQNPIVFSGEAMMNEVLAFKKAGFMLPFYSFQLNLLIESSGLDSIEPTRRYQAIIDAKNNQISFLNVKNKKKLFINRIEPFNLIHLKLQKKDKQLYLVKSAMNNTLTLIKLDAPHISLTINIDNARLKQSQKPTIQLIDFKYYSLKPWAKEWLRLIFDRNIEAINMDILSHQTLSILAQSKTQSISWFHHINTAKN